MDAVPVRLSTVGLFRTTCLTIYDQAMQNDVDVLVGSNQDEGTFFSRPGGTNADQFIKQSKQRFGAMAETFLKLNPQDPMPKPRPRSSPASGMSWDG